MDDASYFALEALSASGAKLLRKSPLHYKAARDTPRVPTPAMIFGTVVHTLALEPEKPAFVVKRLNWASKEGKAERAELEATGLPILNEADGDRALAIRDALHADTQVRDLLAGAKTEQVMLWEQYGVPCKAKADCIQGDMIVDLKTCVDASPSGFQRSVATFQYFVQCAHYLDGLAKTTGKPARDFVFIAVESQPPFAVGVYRLDHDAIKAGAREMQRAAFVYAGCLKTGEWPGYSREVTTLSLPRWAMPADDWSDAA